MISTLTQNELCTATPISSFLQYQVSFLLLPLWVTTFGLIEIFLRKSHECSGKNDIYNIHHWSILWSSYRKFTWVEFEPTTTEFCSEILTDWALRSWVQLVVRTNFVKLLQSHLLSSAKFRFDYCLCQSSCLLWLKFSGGNHMILAEWMIYMTFTTEGFFEVALESWPGRDLNQWPLNSAQTL